jgi:hypothetical protein
MQKYRIEFILHAYNTTGELIKSSLSEFGENLKVNDAPMQETGKGREFAISMIAEEPEAIFDICTQFGRIKSVKVNEEGSI